MLLDDGFLTGDGNHAPDYVKSGDFVLNKDSPQAQGLIGWWPIIEGGGVITRDFSGYGNDFSLSNMDPATDWVTTEFGAYALDFDGSDDLLTVPDSTLLRPQKFTYSARVKTTDSTGPVLIKESDTPWNLLNVDSNKCRMTVTTAGTTDLDGTSSVNDGIEHLLFGSYDGAVMRVCVDGKQENSAVKSGTVSYTTETLKVAWREPDLTDGHRLAARIRDVRLYNIGYPEEFCMEMRVKPWDLYYELGTVSYFSVPAVGGVTVPVFDHHYRSMRAA